jgi:tRNA threonylcarbamoyl adenosine modification protein YeaZ
MKQKASQVLLMEKYGLAIHTISPELGLALNNFAGEYRCQTLDLGRELSSHLHQYLTEFMQPQTWADLAFIAVAKGPGGFTGTRIGVVTARTLAQQLEIPLFAISTLAAVAWQEANKRKDENSSVSNNIAVQMPAQRGQLFGAIYQVLPDNSGLKPLLSDTVMTPEVWQKTLINWPNSYDLIQALSGLGASVSSLLELAHLDWKKGIRPHWSEAIPFYGQHPVEEKKTG